MLSTRITAFNCQSFHIKISSSLPLFSTNISDMSDDSDASRQDAVAPSNVGLEKALRHTVQETYKAGNLEDITIKRVRKAAEVKLDLREGFFKSHSDWNQKSKEIIQSEVVGI